MSSDPKSSRSYISLLWGTLRPKQWIKSSFLFAPALFTLHQLDRAIWFPLVIAALGFSLVASAVYCANDILNRNEDRLHPIKRKRPVASGELRIASAVTLSLICLILGFTLLLLVNTDSALIAAAYLILMLLYSIYLRQVLILDVIIIATGFVLRVIMGGQIIDQPASHWMLLCTFTIALFLGMIKRRQEIASSDPGKGEARAVLADYPELSIVDGWINVLAGMTVLCYALYTVDPMTIAKHGTGNLIYTLPFVLYGIFRYQKLALTDSRGEDPTTLIIRDPGIRIVILLWVVTVAILLYSVNP